MISNVLIQISGIIYEITILHNIDILFIISEVLYIIYMISDILYKISYMLY